MDDEIEKQTISDDAEAEAALQKKHLLMLDRLSKRHQTKPTISSTESSTDSTPSFLSRFSQLKSSIESHLSDSQSISSSDPSHLKSHFDKISQSISDLEKLVAQSSYFLPSYDIRSSLQTVSNLKRTLENLSSELIPKKKFSFKNKVSKKVVTEISESKQIIVPVRDSVQSSFGRDSPGFRNKTDEVLIGEFKESEIGEFTVSDLDSCEVGIIGCVRALFVHRLKNCRVYVGPVTGSILIEEVEGCVFVIASHQIQIHGARISDFYLRVRSRPIVEDCHGVRFASYCLSYPGIEEDLHGAGLDAETRNWANVDDFRWLRAVQSPNWSILSEDERIGIIDISNSECKKEEI